MLIDTHCHLDFKDFDPDRDEAINRAKAAGVELIINVGSSLEGSRRSVELAEKHDCIYASVGIHPHDAAKADNKAFDELKKLASFGKVVAVGEVGLDYYRNLSPAAVQKKCFKDFILFSKELNLPLILHSREAHKDMLAILKEGFPDGKIRGVMHCFSGDENFLMECLSLGLYISFTCNLTFKNAAGLRRLAGKAPVERLLLETDAPFLAPQARRGKRNEPAHLTFLVDELSSVFSLSRDDITRITTHNANELFKLGLEEKAKVAYPIRDSLYLNITNRCTSECDFCVRYFSDHVKGHKLRLEKEPAAAEVINALGDIGRYREIVFCGYGEPTLRLDVLKEVAAVVKKRGRSVRLVTNGHGNLINKRPIAAELAGLVDRVSVSLNVDNEEKYEKICRPRFGKGTFEEVKRFTSDCKKSGLKVEVTCLDLPGTDIDRCRSIAADELGVEFRLRRHNVVG
ncbi:MAG: YchF/TatD family DNA exonuclease [Candidatus Omnitrophica bacterium]|nr:YchF/TatD family DNA exonuclease [Candidatus Omnitrophota bacterium]